MLFSVEIPQSMAKEIDKLVLEGRYPDHGALLRAALNNLLAEEDNRDIPSVVNMQPRGTAMSHPGKRNREGQDAHEEVAADILSPPEVERSRPLDYLAVRLLPATAIVSHLSRYLRSEGVPRANLAKFSVYVAQECVKLKSMLTQFDNSRDVKLSTGFPDPSPNSMQRYIQVFVGGRRGDMAHGIAASLGLIGFATGESGQEEVGLTARGVDIATTDSELQQFIHGDTSSLPNPIFSEREFNILTLSLLEHPGEASLVKTIMSRLREEDSGRIELNAVSRAHFEKHFPEETISDNVVITHAAATTLRLRELGLVKGIRNKKGLIYQLTKKGHDWGEEVGLW